MQATDFDDGDRSVGPSVVTSVPSGANSGAGCACVGQGVYGNSGLCSALL